MLDSAPNTFNAERAVMHIIFNYIPRHAAAAAVAAVDPKTTAATAAAANHHFKRRNCIECCARRIAEPQHYHHHHHPHRHIGSRTVEASLWGGLFELGPSDI